MGFSPTVKSTPIDISCDPLLVVVAINLASTLSRCSASFVSHSLVYHASRASLISLKILCTGKLFATQA